MYSLNSPNLLQICSPGIGYPTPENRSGKFQTVIEGESYSTDKVAGAYRYTASCDKRENVLISAE